MQRRMTKYGGTLFFAGVLALTGCSGSKGTDGANGTNGTSGVNGTNGTNGANGTNGVSGKLSLTIDSVATGAPVDGTGTSTVTFTIRPAAAVCPGGTCVDDLSNLGQKTFYAVQFDSTTNTFSTTNNFAFFSSGKGVIHFKAITADGNGAQYTATNDPASNPVKFAPEASQSAVVYGYITNLAALPAPTTGHYYLPSNVASAAKVFGTVAYNSDANVSGCENCHNKPYSKHGYRQASVAGLNPFVSCKVCHTDQKVGSDGNWYMKADDPANYAASLTVKGALDATHAAKYAYTANLMNDVHNSHAFEFNYPQSMANCVTCHGGKLQNILTDANFKPTVCKSCHPVTGPGCGTTTPCYTGGVESGRAPSLAAIWADKNLTAYHTMDMYAATANGVDADPTLCNTCHKTGGGGKTFAQIHGGFSKKIYSAENTRYASTIKVTVGATSFDATTNLLTIPFSIAGTTANALVKPTVVISLYGYGSKDFVVSGHGGYTDGTSLLEYTDGAMQRANPTLSANSARLTLNPATTTAGVTQWTATADLSMWASMITAGTVKRVQVNVLPTIGLDQTKAVDENEYVTNAGVTQPNQYYNQSIAVTGASVAIDIPAGTVNAAAYGAAIVDTTNCNKCHDALGTTFHTPNYGSAGVVACRVCHWVGAASAHLEMQSRSIDSFIHSIHQMQYLDIKNVSLTDPIQALRYSDHVEGNYPNFAGTLNCESCHTKATASSSTYEVPDQALSLPGILSAASAFKTGTRTIASTGTSGEITGPAARACGACHRAKFINEDDAPSLAAFYAHFGGFGTSVTVDTSSAASAATAATLTAITGSIMSQVGGPAYTGTAAPTGTEVESCTICHPTAGADHQNLFNTWKNGL